MIKEAVNLSNLSTCLDFSAELPGQRWWPFCGTGSLHCGQCVKVVEVLLGHQWPERIENVGSPLVLLGEASFLAWGDLEHGDAHQIE